METISRRTFQSFWCSRSRLDLRRDTGFGRSLEDFYVERNRRQTLSFEGHLALQERELSLQPFELEA